MASFSREVGRRGGGRWRDNYKFGFRRRPFYRRPRGASRFFSPKRWNNDYHSNRRTGEDDGGGRSTYSTGVGQKYGHHDGRYRVSVLRRIHRGSSGYHRRAVYRPHFRKRETFYRNRRDSSSSSSRRDRSTARDASRSKDEGDGGEGGEVGDDFLLGFEVIDDIAWDEDEDASKKKKTKVDSKATTSASPTPEGPEGDPQLGGTGVLEDFKVIDDIAWSSKPPET